MKPYRGRLLMSAILLAALPLSGCGDATDGFRTESGSYLTAEVAQESLEPDIHVDICEETTDSEGNVTFEYEPGLTNTYTSVTLHNNSAPNTPDDSSTNQDVTMSRYEVSWIGINKSVSIEPFSLGGSSVLVPKDGSASMTVIVLDLDTLAYIRDNYPSVGRGEGLGLTATIKIWGEDALGQEVTATASTTLNIQNYDRCP